MERTTISLPAELIVLLAAELIVRLRIMAAERRTSMAAIIREALEEKAKETGTPPKPTSLGIADSGRSDLSRLASEGPVPPVSWR